MKELLQRHICEARKRAQSPAHQDSPCLKAVLNNDKLCVTIVPLLRWILSFEDFSLQFLVFLHLVLCLRSIALFAI
jgi:hypothetical protein